MYTYCGHCGLIAYLTLAQAWRELRSHNGIGCIFRGQPTTYARPIFPRPLHPAQRR